MKPKSFLLLTTVFIFCTSIFCQEKKDTIYFDEDWSICEKPVAEYYRVCTLNRENVLFYKGSVQDYYIDGKPEMTGNYSDNGYKNGEFIFYNTNGIILKKENYTNGESTGNWSYYDSTGNLKAEFICNSSVDFTPIFLVDNNNDTLIKNGNGKFSFHVQKDLPDIFPVSEEYYVKGEIDDSLKNGLFTYHTPQDIGNALFSEIYKDGKFIKGKSYDAVTKEPLKLLHLKDDKLERTDMFNHSNPVFNFSENSQQKLINFLLTGETPEIESSSKSFYDNDAILFYVIGRVLRASLSKNIRRAYLLNFPSSDQVENYYRFLSENNDKKALRNIEGNIALAIDTTGHVFNSAFNTTLTRTEIDKINYYLGNIVGLIPYQNDNQKSIVNINLSLKTTIDTLKNNKISVVYMIYNSDSANNKNMLITDAGAEIAAKPPIEWNKYLERNLNGRVPVYQHAPNGLYTVTVSFIIDEYGSIYDVEAEHDPGYGMAEEAVRVIKNGPRWTPAIQFGKNVKSRQMQDIKFEVSR